jgi:hypothetical protein
MSVPAGIALPWQGVFASAGAQAEHEQRAARLWGWIRRLIQQYRRPAPDRETLIALHRNREIARRLERENVGVALRLGGAALR